MDSTKSGAVSLFGSDTAKNSDCVTSEEEPSTNGNESVTGNDDPAAPAPAANAPASSPVFPRRPRTLGLRELGIMMNARRQATLKPKRGTATGWIDQDDSGTYDPTVNRTPRKALVHRRKKVRHERNGNRDSRRGGSRSTKPVTGYAYMVSFSFEKEAGRAYLRSITPDPGPYPVYTSGDDNSSSGSELEADRAESSIAARKRVRKSRMPTAQVKRLVFLLWTLSTC